MILEKEMLPTTVKVVEEIGKMLLG